MKILNIVAKNISDLLLNLVIYCMFAVTFDLIYKNNNIS